MEIFMILQNELSWTFCKSNNVDFLWKSFRTCGVNVGTAVADLWRKRHNRRMMCFGVLAETENYLRAQPIEPIESKLYED